MTDDAIKAAAAYAASASISSGEWDAFLPVLRKAIEDRATSLVAASIKERSRRLHPSAQSIHPSD